MSSLVRLIAGACVLASVAGFASLSACSGSTGVPAAPAPLEPLTYDSGSTPVVDAKSTPTHYVNLVGTVRKAATDAGLPGAFVIGELGGLGPDGGDATLAIDPAIQRSAIAIDGGAFGIFHVAQGHVGLRVFDKEYLEGRRLVGAEATDASDANAVHTLVSLVPLDRADASLARSDGGAILRPVATGLTASSASSSAVLMYVSPGEPVAFAVKVAAGSPADPLSSDVILLELVTGWAGALNPSTAAVPGRAYPDGVYSRIVAAPTAPGAYHYTLVVASLKGVTSEPVSVDLTVTATGAAPAEAGLR